MKSRVKARLFALIVAVVLVIGGTFASLALVSPARAASVTNYTGSLDGAAYLIQVPTPWNGTLVLYSHGYVVPGASNPATDVGDAATGSWLLAHGYALAGSAYSTTGWAIQQAFQDQIDVLDHFDTLGYGHPSRTIAWGHSLGGIITAGLVQLNPGRFAGALPMCGVLAGGVGTWNQALDSAFAFNVLLAGNALSIVNLPPLGSSALTTDFNQAEGVLQNAQKTAQGRARIAL
ncbi:MAG TPA: prolyl oligopeptidase family serine peptidase, partial [Ktedonobacterales bacterium]|nr:prolyl oligopeptidase family serine peptidase [Ktedonobacterales bacterium]